MKNKFRKSMKKMKMMIKWKKKRIDCFKIER